MKMPKPTEADKDYFRSLIPEDPRVEIKPMFGNLGAFVNGTMFMGLFGSAVGIRLPEPEREALLQIESTRPFGPEERPMKEYVSLPAAWRDSPEESQPWIEKSLEHAASLPPKKG